MHPVDLRCELLASPRGLNTRAPRFGWALTGGGIHQTAYEISVGDTAGDVTTGRGSHWVSGKTFSDEQLFVAYAGRTLCSDEVLFWSVRVWDENDVASDWAPAQSFLTGLMDHEDWHASWIARYFVLPAGREAPADTIYDNRWQARPADHLRQEFSTRGEVVRATAYVTALGLYELYLNGTRVGDDVMAPGWTDYHQRVLYQSHDVTHLLRDGVNAIGALIGEGWYSGRVGHNQRRAGNHYGGRPALCCQINLHYADGTVDHVVSDETWRTSQGAVCYSDFLMGEQYDARLEMAGWAEPGFDQSAWQPVEAFTPEPRAPALVAEKSPPTRELMSFAGKLLHRARNGDWIYDFGQNFAGYCQLAVTAPAGALFTLRHAEILAPDGDLYTANLRHAVSTDHYIARGEGREVFKPRFTFHGFRYAALSLPENVPPDAVELTGIAIGADLDQTGEIETGNALVNQLISNIEWSQRGNFLSVPTDCPQRDERLGWSADAQVFWRTAGFNMDVSGFFAKWLDDITDAQLPDGAFTDIAPSRPLNPYRITAQPGAPGWGDGPALMCWQHYLRYGDRQLLEKAYPALQRWIAHVADANPDFIRVHAVYNNYGDWLSVGPASDRTMVATAYWIHLADTMNRIAEALGRTGDARDYAKMATKIRNAFAEHFVDTEGRISGDTQTAYLLALDFDILPDTMRPALLAHLIARLDAADGHLQTGFLGVRHLCPVLTDSGASDYAYRLLLNDTYPSWGFSIRQGATTIWERWDGWTPERGFQSANMNSFNHYAYGSVGEWLYARMAGIDWDLSGPGFRAISFRPIFDKRIGHVNARYRAPTGMIVSRWRIEGDEARWHIEIPPNCTGQVELAGRRFSVTAGTHEFTTKLDEGAL